MKWRKEKITKSGWYKLKDTWGDKWIFYLRIIDSNWVKVYPNKMNEWCKVEEMSINKFLEEYQWSGAISLS